MGFLESRVRARAWMSRSPMASIPNTSNSIAAGESGRSLPLLERQLKLKFGCIPARAISAFPETVGGPTRARAQRVTSFRVRPKRILIQSHLNAPHAFLALLAITALSPRFSPPPPETGAREAILVLPTDLTQRRAPTTRYDHPDDYSRAKLESKKPAISQAPDDRATNF